MLLPPNSFSVQVDYLISVSAYKVSTFDSNFRVVIDVEDKWAGNIWRGDYKHQYIEEITQKAGKPQKFQEFIKLLITALEKKQTEEIFVDLLTQYDLVCLKAKKSGQAANAPPRPTGEADLAQKRYIILTNVHEFEKTHFPLPLSHLAEPDIGTLRRTF